MFQRFEYCKCLNCVLNISSSVILVHMLSRMNFSQIINFVLQLYYFKCLNFMHLRIHNSFVEST